MVGLLVVAGFFLAVVLAYVCTEYLLVRFDARGRVLTGAGHPLLVVLTCNLLSFTLLWASASVFIAASGAGLYDAALAAVVCFSAQIVWLVQHLWFYYRDHLRLRYKN